MNPAASVGAHGRRGRGLRASARALSKAARPAPFGATMALGFVTAPGQAALDRGDFIHGASSSASVLSS